MTTALQFAHMMDADAFLGLTASPIDFNLAGDNVLVSGVESQKIYVYRIFLVTAAIMDLTFKDGLSTALTGAISMQASGAIVLDISNAPWFQTSPGNDFILNSSQSGEVAGVVYFQQS